MYVAYLIYEYRAKLCQTRAMPAKSGKNIYNWPDL